MAFATADDLALLLELGELSETQTDRAELLLDLATGCIADSLGQGATWAEELDPVPTTMRSTCLSVVARVWNNPEALRQAQESIGSGWTESRTYGAVGLEVTEAERRQMRAALGQPSSASAHVGSWIDDVYDPDGNDEES